MECVTFTESVRKRGCSSKNKQTNCGTERPSVCMLIGRFGGGGGCCRYLVVIKRSGLMQCQDAFGDGNTSIYRKLSVPLLIPYLTNFSRPPPTVIRPEEGSSTFLTSYTKRINHWFSSRRTEDWQNSVVRFPVRSLPNFTGSGGTTLNSQQPTTSNQQQQRQSNNNGKHVVVQSSSSCFICVSVFVFVYHFWD